MNTDRLKNGDDETIITVEFIDLPNEIILDDSVKTTLESEYLLTENKTFKIIKRYKNGGKAKVSVEALHPTHESCHNLLELTNSKLKTQYEGLALTSANKTKNAELRKSIWENFSKDNNIDDGLLLKQYEVDTSKEDTKRIIEKINTFLPLYTLFQADRKNHDGDSEIQDPMKIAIKEILATEEIQERLIFIANKVSESLAIVGEETLEKIKEMDENLAKTLNPTLPEHSKLKWEDTFKNVSITGDDNIPINKRGSGVRRLILLNFFRADAERRIRESSGANVIYAIEEPETSLQNDFQIQLIQAFKRLSEANKTQVILTTHSPTIVKQLDFEDIKLITIDNKKKKSMQVSEDVVPYPSINEVNYLAFDEISEEYHNELYGIIDELDRMKEFKDGKPQIPYLRGEKKEWNLTLTEYVRHQIHHPENRLNDRYTHKMLIESVLIMREFLLGI